MMRTSESGHLPEVNVPRSIVRSCLTGIAIAASTAIGTLAIGTPAPAQEMNAALKALAAAANKEGSLTLSWSGSTFGGIQGAARFQAAMNRLYGTNIRVNFLPGADMARIVNQLATEYSASQK